MPLQILVYDDHDELRESLSAMLQHDADFLTMAMFDNAETVEQDVLQLKPDIILMDIDMPRVGGVEAVRRVRKINKDIPIIMLTVFDDNDNIFNAIYAGATGYILKRFATVELVPALRSVMSGGAPMTGSVAKKVLQMLPAARSKEEEHVYLNKKETDILRLLVEGYSYKMIAAQQDLTIDGVRFHIKKIYDKLHVHSATEAVARALRDKLI